MNPHQIAGKKTHIGKSREQLIKEMKERGQASAQKRALAFQTLAKVEWIKIKWKQSEGKWSKELKETIVSNLFS